MSALVWAVLKVKADNSAVSGDGAWGFMRIAGLFVWSWVAVLGARGALEDPSRYSVVGPEAFARGIAAAGLDDAGAGFCARGTWNVLRAVGLARGLESKDAHDWEAMLRRAGWVAVYCPYPEMAPYGTVVVYESDVRARAPVRDTLGGRYGHVEWVAYCAQRRQRCYVSDAVRTEAGGTVADRFTGRAWVPPDFARQYGVSWETFYSFGQQEAGRGYGAGVGQAKPAAAVGGDALALPSGNGQAENALDSEAFMDAAPVVYGQAKGADHQDELRWRLLVVERLEAMRRNLGVP